MATPKYSYQENPSSDLTGFKVEKENNADSGKDRENSPTESNT